MEGKERIRLCPKCGFPPMDIDGQPVEGEMCTSHFEVVSGIDGGASVQGSPKMLSFISKRKKEEKKDQK